MKADACENTVCTYAHNISRVKDVQNLEPKPTPPSPEPPPLGEPPSLWFERLPLKQVGRQMHCSPWFKLKLKFYGPGYMS